MNYDFKELRQIAEQVCKEENYPCPQIEFKNVRRGKARTKTKKITIPLWTVRGTKKEYSLYYIIHELTHFIVNKGNHGEEFKTKETEILRRYNIIPIYAKAYAKELRDLKGNKLCGRLGK